MMMCGIIFCNLEAITFEINLYNTMQQAMGLKSLTVTGLGILSNKVIAVPLMAGYIYLSEINL